MEGLFLVLLELAALERVPVEDAGQGGLQALDVGAPVDGGDDVGKRVGALVFIGFAVPGRPLQGHLDRDRVLGELRVGVVLRGQVDDVGVDRRPLGVGVDLADVVGDAVARAEDGFGVTRPAQDELQAFHQERLFPQASFDGGVRVAGVGLEDAPVESPPDRRPPLRPRL